LNKSLRLRLHEAAQTFEARAQAWPVWQRLVVLVPIFLVLAWLLVVAIMAVIVGLRAMISH
jgi:uncharacterized protein (DUF983 family)